MSIQINDTVSNSVASRVDQIAHCHIQGGSSQVWFMYSYMPQQLSVDYTFRHKPLKRIWGCFRNFIAHIVQVSLLKI